MTGKNWISFGGDTDHVMLGFALGLQLPWQRLALSECCC